MGCGNCGSSADGKPSGCKGNGGCSTGGCNRLNVFDWLSALPLHDSAKPYPIVEVTFNKGSRKEFYRNSTNHILEKSDWITVEGVSGFDVGQVSLTGELVKLQMKKYGVNDDPTMKRIMRLSTEDDLALYNKQKNREPEILTISRTISRNLKLDMKLCEVEVQADGKKATFFYTADQRVDFRELIKLYANDFKVKVEMRQIGARQESGKVGGIGSCGRELCCSTWLTDFKSVNTTAARYQNLSINQTKLSGQCGRLKCCLNYELDTYMDALRVFPDGVEVLETVKGRAMLQKKDIFKNLMWYSYSDSSKQYPLSIVRVKEIQAQNKEGIKPDELQPVELEINSKVQVEVGFVNDVGQISLKALERSSNKKRNNNNKQGGSNRPQNAAPQGDRKPQQGQQQQSNRPPRPQNNSPRAPREQRPQGDRPQGGDRSVQGNRPQQQAGAQPGGEQQQRAPNNRPPREQRPPRPPKEPRPQGERPAGGERPQQQAGGEPGAEQPQRQQNRPPREPRPPRPPREQRPQGDRPQGERPPQQAGDQQQPRPQQNRPPREPREPRPPQAPNPSA